MRAEGTPTESEFKRETVMITFILYLISLNQSYRQLSGKKSLCSDGDTDDLRLG